MTLHVSLAAPEPLALALAGGADSRQWDRGRGSSGCAPIIKNQRLLQSEPEDRWQCIVGGEVLYSSVFRMLMVSWELLQSIYSVSCWCGWIVALREPPASPEASGQWRRMSSCGTLSRWLFSVSTVICEPVLLSIKGHEVAERTSGDVTPCDPCDPCDLRSPEPNTFCFHTRSG